MDLIQRLEWRYATKKMNPAKAVPQDKARAKNCDAAYMWSRHGAAEPSGAGVTASAISRKRLLRSNVS